MKTFEINETLKAQMDKDISFLEIDDITRDKVDEETLLKHAFINYSMLTEIYTFLQSKSQQYPWIDNYTFREFFIKELGVIGAEDFNMRKFDVLMAAAQFN